MGFELRIPTFYLLLAGNGPKSFNILEPPPNSRAPPNDHPPTDPSELTHLYTNRYLSTSEFRNCDLYVNWHVTPKKVLILTAFWYSTDIVLNKSKIAPWTLSNCMSPCVHTIIMSPKHIIMCLRLPRLWALLHAPQQHVTWQILQKLLSAAPPAPVCVCVCVYCERMWECVPARRGSPLGRNLTWLLIFILEKQWLNKCVHHQNQPQIRFGLPASFYLKNHLRIAFPVN